MTSTPALAASLDVSRDARVTVGYGLAYPFGVIGVILFVQIVPRLFRLDLQAESVQAESAVKSPPVTRAWFLVKNPLIQGKTIAAIWRIASRTR